MLVTSNVGRIENLTPFRTPSRRFKDSRENRRISSAGRGESFRSRAAREDMKTMRDCQVKVGYFGTTAAVAPWAELGRFDVVEILEDVT